MWQCRRADVLIAAIAAAEAAKRFHREALAKLLD